MAGRPSARPSLGKVPYFPIAAPWGANFSTQGSLGTVQSSHKIETLGFGPDGTETEASLACPLSALIHQGSNYDADFVLWPSEAKSIGPTFHR